MNSCLKFIVKGNVQGVFYRKYVSKAMNSKKIIGYIRNLENGDVEVLVKNRDGLNIKDIFDILYEGSPKSEVKAVEMVECKEDILFKSTFEVRY
jgi:acylphosphatase